mgnify:CR=1 FL=1
MKVDLFDFDLPEERIALRPAEPRDSARLLKVAAGSPMEDRGVRDLPAGAELIRQMQLHEHSGLLPVGVIDDDPRAWGRTLHELTAVLRGERRPALDPLTRGPEITEVR